MPARFLAVMLLALGLSGAAVNAPMPAMAAGPCNYATYVGTQALPNLPGRWGIMPAFPGDTPQTRSWLMLHIARQHTFCTGALLVNYTKHSLPLTVWTTDAQTGLDGSFLIPNLGTPQLGLGRWTKLGIPTLVTVPPHRFVYIPVVIRIPAHTPVGDHLGAIEARSPYAPIHSNGGLHLNVATQIGLRMYLHVPGRPRVAPLWSHLQCLLGQKSALSCSVQLQNNGSLTITGQGTLKLSPLWGDSAKVELQAPVETGIWPGSTEKLTAQVVHPAPGIYRAVAELRAGGHMQQLQVTIIVPPPPQPFAVIGGLLVFLSWPRGRRAVFAALLGAFRGAFSSATVAWRPQE